MSDEAFFNYFTDSLPTSVDVFITMYENQSFSIDHLYDKFTKYELWRACRDLVDGRGESENIVMYSHSASGSGSRSRGDEWRRRDSSDVTCFACGKKGHIRRWCLDKSKSGAQSDTSKADASKSEASDAKPNSGGGEGSTALQGDLSLGQSTQLWRM